MRLSQPGGDEMRVILATLLALIASESAGAPQTYACNMLFSSQTAGDFLRLGQLSLEVDAKAISFSVANTRGTMDPIALELTESLGDEPGGEVLMKLGSKSVRAVGFSGNVGFVFFMEDQFGPSNVQISLGIAHFVWHCSR